MDIEKLIEQLRWWADHCDRTNYGCHAKPFLLDAAAALSTLQAENEKLRGELEQVKRERDEAIKTIFQWVGCPECKWWDSADEWCEKYDREADSCGGCESPEWRGQKEE